MKNILKYLKHKDKKKKLKNFTLLHERAVKMAISSICIERDMRELARQVWYQSVHNRKKLYTNNFTTVTETDGGVLKSEDESAVFVSALLFPTKELIVESN